MATVTEHRKKLELKANVPVDVVFKFPKPIERDGQYGPYDMWTVVLDGEDHSLYASNSLKEALRKAAPQAGEVLRITKTERENGKGFDYTVERPVTEQPKTTPSNGQDREQALISGHVHRYVSIAKELCRQWPALVEKNPEMYAHGVHTIYIQMSRNGNGR